MERTVCVLILPLFSLLLCNGAKGSDTFELPRNIEQASSLQMEEVNIGGQKRYRILTDHYDITASQCEDGILASERLEHLFHAWKLLSAEFFKETKNESASYRHRIILYRNKQEYMVNLQRFDPLIARTNGFYYPPRKMAYFFSSETKVLFHEGTHQIFEEYLFREKKPIFRNNFWAVEGIALFIETLQIEEQSYKVGNLLDDRLYAAKVYQFQQNYNLPIRKLTAMSAAEIKPRADIVKIYSQSATLVYWLMFAEEGRYRKPLFELLHQTYLDSAKPETLSELTGLPYEELDKKYMEFLKTIPDEL